MSDVEEENSGDEEAEYEENDDPEDVVESEIVDNFD